MSNAHVLVVDDEADIRALIKDILTDEGYVVTGAADAGEARAARAAQSRGISLGEFIREALTHLLRAEHDAADQDPLIGDSAVYEGPGPSDTVERHDDLLYGPARRR